MFLSSTAFAVNITNIPLRDKAPARSGRGADASYVGVVDISTERPQISELRKLSREIMKERDTFYRDLGARIRARREELKLTQVGLADLIGISRPSLTNIESGKQRILVDQLFDISTKLTISIQDLVPKGAYDAERPGSDLSKMPVVANFVESIFAETER